MMKFIFFFMSLMLMILINMNKSKLLIQNYLFIITFIMIMNLNLKNFLGSKIYYMYGMDKISFFLIILTFWIISLCLISNNNFLFNKSKMNFWMLMILLSLILLLSFSIMNMFLFYIFFESSLIPLILLIMGWGMQIDRIQASMYMLFYTLFGSLPLLIMLFYLYMNLSNNSFIILILNNNLNLNNFILYLATIMAFLIKLPMYFTHLWLPKAHVEAPISGSMILASIMLKLGTYGLYRLMPIFNFMNNSFNYIFISISLMGSIYSSLICLTQTDMKIIVAYSSIVHMNMLLASLLTLNYWSLNGSFFMMLAHGLCSSSMFCLVNFNYERIHSRNLMMNKGFINIFPSLSLWWFLICSSNFSSPPSLNLFSEIFLINGLISWMYLNMIFIFLITFFSTCYSIYLFSYSQHGKLFSNTLIMKFINIREFIILILHWLPLNILFVNLNLLN
uniref:NADH-ubiquinone oxidoreductase chain 4 n=1 Tax=Capitonius sp. QL-2013 TaxID=1421593 RepID=A0A0A6ZKU4_9HYME|nr:NADH dehydrogenase subunit 4 [Capitonius sp. QL-2013]